MEKLPHHTALKEWDSVVNALGRGDQVILIRKGGIADADFAVEAERFYLYPTFFHQTDHQTPEDAVTIGWWCEVVRMWRTRDSSMVDELAHHVVIPLDALRTRFRFRADQALNIIGVRTFALPTPMVIRARPEYEGCRSWISVEDEIDVTGSRAVLPDEELARRLDAVQGLLSTEY